MSGGTEHTDVRPNRIFKHMCDNGVTNRLTKIIVKLGLSPCIIMVCKFYFIFFKVLGQNFSSKLCLFVVFGGQNLFGKGDNFFTIWQVDFFFFLSTTRSCWFGM